MFTKSLVVLLCLAGCKSREIVIEPPKPIVQEPAHNEDEAQVLEWMSQHLPPAEIKQKFISMQQEAREKFNREDRNRRTHYTAVEKANAEAFSKALKVEREGRTTPSLIADQGVRRKEYFEKEQADRLQFNSELRAKLNEFNARMEERLKDLEKRLAVYSSFRAQP